MKKSYSMNFATSRMVPMSDPRKRIAKFFISSYNNKLYLKKNKEAICLLKKQLNFVVL